MTVSTPDGSPSTVPPPVERLAAGFVHCLRTGGLVVPVGMTLRFTEALDAVGLDDGNDVYWAGRATLVSRPEDIAMYDAMFLAFFHKNGVGFKVRFEDEPDTTSVATDDGDDSGENDGSDDVEALRYSASETLGEKDFAEFTKAELAEAQSVMSKMRLHPSQRRSRRRTPNRRGDRQDLRRTVQAAMRTAGEPLGLRRTSAGKKTRRLVLLLDVSGSMEPYARVLIRFAHAAVVGRGRVEVFGLGTRLTRMTRQLASHDVDEAIAAAAEEVVDWSGGTRLGEAIGRFNDEWGVRGMARGAIVVVLSDGWDRGDPEQMSTEMERLQRTAHKVIWVNPLKASPGYEPIARGMAAAMPHIDLFLEGHCLDSLSTLADSIGA
ncbi:MAG: VWA domain-containing protein [Acidimicrobiia bacterium]|nr:VWA domain-containing protein [Acidimicrobiia bacterium]